MIKAIKGRPVAFFCFAFVIFLYLSYKQNVTDNLITCFATIILSALIILLGFTVKNKRARVLFLLLPLTLGSSAGVFYGYNYSSSVISQTSDFRGQTVTASGRIEKVLYENDFSTAYKMKITELDGKKSDITALVKFPFPYQADEYDVLSFDAVFTAPSSNGEFGFNEKKYCLSNGMTTVCIGGENVTTVSKSRSLLAFTSSLSRKLSARFRLSLGEYNGGFMSGLILGRRDNIPDKLSTSFEYLGLSHILSVSGLHLSIIIGSLYFIFSKTPIPIRLRFIISTAVTVFLVLLTGAGVAVIRAAIMLTLTSAAYLHGRDYDPLTALAVSAFIILLIEPLAVFAPSFVLSFSATLGIILLGIPACSQISKAILGRSALIRTLGGIGMTAAITLSATIFTFPAVYSYFGAFSSISVFANLLFIPLCTALMFLGIILSLTYGTFIAPFVSVTASALAKLIDGLSYAISQACPEPLSLTYDFVKYLLIILFAAFLLLSCLKLKGTVCIIVLSVIFISGYSIGVHMYSDSRTVKSEVLCINDSDNDYLLLHKNGSTLLCDMSNGSTSPLYSISELSVEYFHDTCPDVLLLTHLHRMHISFIRSFTDNNRPEKLILPSARNEAEKNYIDSIEKIAAEKNIKIEYYSSDSDSTIDFMGCKITVFSPVIINRSTQPITLVSIKDGAVLNYCGGAINETDLMDDLKSVSTGETYIWFGTHGPVEKEPLFLTFTPHKAFVSNDELNNVYKTHFEVINFQKYIALRRK